MNLTDTFGVLKLSFPVKKAIEFERFNRYIWSIETAR